MNTIKVKINFEKGTCTPLGIDLVKGDYNSTKMLFEFDRQDGTKILEIKNTKTNELVYASEIIDNEAVLVGKNENGELCSLFNEAGGYIFEVSLYDGDSKLTSTYETLRVLPEMVEIDSEVVTQYLPIFDQLISKVNNAITETNNLDLDIENSVITITKKDGTIKSENVKGDAYVITDEDYNEIETNVKSSIQPILENIENISKQAEVIAKGRATGYVFDTLKDLDLWLQDSENVSKLVLGDNFYIRATDVPDYWWDGTSKQVLETQKVELGDYVKSSKENNIVYCKYEHQDYGIEFSSSSAKAFTMVRRDSRGCVISAEPVIDTELTTKKYVDENIAKSFGKNVVVTVAEYGALLDEGKVDENTFYYIREE